jgi:site-specific recombinase XerD
MTRDESLQQFEAYLRRRFPERRTPVDYVSDVRQFARACNHPWREVTMHHIDAFVDEQRQAGLSPATVKRRVAALKTFFDFLAEDSGDLAWPNPVRFKRHAGKQPRRLPRDLNDDTVERLWEQLSAVRDRAWFVLLLRAGLRVGEVVLLELSDVLAPANGDQPARLRVRGKGQKERLVLLTGDAYQVLAAWLQVRPTNPSQRIFLNAHGRPLSANGIEWLLRDYSAALGRRVTPHQLRHTFARQVTEAGMPLPSLGKLLGHAQISTTQIYTAGADPGLVQAYQTAMQRLAAEPLTPGAAPPIAAPALPDEPNPAPPPALPEWAQWAPHLPEALRQASIAWVQQRLPSFGLRRQRQKALHALAEFRRFWEWQVGQRPISQVADLRLSDLWAYQTARAIQGKAASTINDTLEYVLALLHAQADQGQPIDASVFRLRALPRPDSLPRYLPEDQWRRLEAFVQAQLDDPSPTSRLEQACFFVLAHTGLRASECVDLRVGDLDLSGGRLWVRQGKGQRDRVVYLSDRARQALVSYLGERQPHPASPLWLRPGGQPIGYPWLITHIAALGAAAGVEAVTPHRLRHTLATRLLNGGMEITSIQKLLGHEHLDTTLIYARVLDTTVEADYRRAMRQIEQRQMPLSDVPETAANWPTRQPAVSVEPVAIGKVLLDNSI